MKTRTYELLDRGRWQELYSKDGLVISKVKPFETVKLWSEYWSNEARTEIDEKLADNLAEKWDKYFKLGKDEYRRQVMKPKESKRLRGYVIEVSPFLIDISEHNTIKMW